MCLPRLRFFTKFFHNDDENESSDEVNFNDDTPDYTPLTHQFFEKSDLGTDDDFDLQKAAQPVNTLSRRKFDRS